MPRSNRKILPFLCRAMALGSVTAPVAARPETRHNYRLPAQPLEARLRAIAVEAGYNVVAPAELLTGRTAPAVQGRFSDQLWYRGASLCVRGALQMCTDNLMAPRTA